MNFMALILIKFSSKTKKLFGEVAPEKGI